MCSGESADGDIVWMMIGQSARESVVEACSRGGRKKSSERVVSVKAVVGEDHSFGVRGPS